MKTSVERTDISDIQPNDQFGRGSQKLVYLALMVLGLILIGLGAYSRVLNKESWLPELCIAAGVATTAPGVLSYLYRRYMLEEIKLEMQQPAERFKEAAIEMVREALDEITSEYRAELDLLKSAHDAKLAGIYVSRAAALQAFLPFIEEERNEIIVAGSSLRGLLQEDDAEYANARDLLKRKVKAGVRVRFLLTHPMIADLRAKQEGRNPTDIGKEIVDSLETLTGGDWKVDEGSIKLYMGTPTCFGIKTSMAALLNPYPFMREAFASPCLIVRKGGYFYESFHVSHFRAWTSALALSAPAELSDLRQELKSYADAVQQLTERRLVSVKATAAAS